MKRNKRKETEMTTLKTTVFEILGEHTDVHSELFCGEGVDEDDSFMLALAAEGVVIDFKEQHGGEGEGDKYWSVYEFKQGDESVHVKFDGWYASHVGSEMTDYFFVEPKQVTVTEYV
jgi:hypothetical protein